MPRTSEHILQKRTGCGLSLGALRTGLLLGFSGGLSLGHLQKCLLAIWQSLQIQRLMSQSDVLFLLSAFTCMSIDILSSVTGLTVGTVFMSRMPNIIDALSHVLFEWNLIGPVILVASCAAGAVLGSLFFSYPWLSGVLSVPLVLLAGTWALNILAIIKSFFKRIQAFSGHLKNKTSNVYINMKHYMDTSVLMYVTLLMNTLTFLALEKIGYYIKISVLLNILLPLQLFPSAIRISDSSSRRAERVCIYAALWTLVVVSVLMCVPRLSPGPSVGAAVGATGAFRVTLVAAGGTILNGHKDKTLGVTVGATLGAFMAFYFCE